MKQSEAKQIFLSLLPTDGSEIPYDQFRATWPKTQEMGLKDAWGAVRRSGAVAVRLERDEDGKLMQFVSLPKPSTEVKTS